MGGRLGQGEGGPVVTTEHLPPAPAFLTEWERQVWVAGFEAALLAEGPQDRRRRPDLFQAGYLAGSWERVAQLLNRPGEGALLHRRATEMAENPPPVIVELRKHRREVKL